MLVNFIVFLLGLMPPPDGNLLRNAEWSQWSPRPELAPAGRREPELFTLQASRFEQYGRWKTTVAATPGAYYRFEGRYQAQGIADENTSVAVMLSWWSSPQGTGEIQRDYVDGLERAGEWKKLYRTVQAPEGAKAVSVELVLRWTAGGAVTFSGIRLDRAPVPAPRVVRLATTRITPPPGATLESNRRLIAEMAERVGAAHPDLVLVYRKPRLPRSEKASARNRRADSRAHHEHPLRMGSA